MSRKANDSHRVNITLPVFNEVDQLAGSVHCLHNWLLNNTEWRFEIVIADNGSTDGTGLLARRLAREYPFITVFHSASRGRGGAVKAVWMQSSMDVLSYMDIDLSTSLDSFGVVVSEVLCKSADLCVGSRLSPGSIVSRGLKREIISRCYNLLVKVMFGTHFSDAQCGCKVITRSAAKRILPLVEDTKWFMDTELLVLAEHMGLRVIDVPVRWVDDSDSRVNIWQTAVDDLMGVYCLRKRLKVLRADKAPPLAS